MALTRILKIKPKMVFFFILTGLIPLIFVGLLGTNLAQKALMEKSFEQMNAIQSIRSDQVSASFRERLTDLRLLTHNKDLQDMLRDINRYHTESGVSTMRSLDTDSSEYRSIYNRYNSFFEDFINSYHYRDFYLLCAEHGHIMYSVENGRDAGSNLEYGPYRNSGLALLWQTVVETGDSAIVDFMPYDPDDGEQAAFLGVPLYDEEENLEGIAALQLGTEFISSILNSRKGMGNTGESYILRWFREDNSFSLRSRIHSMDLEIGKTEEENMEYWEDAVKAGGTGGGGIYKDTIGNDILATYNPLSIGGLDWFLITKMDKAEVIEPMRLLIMNILIAAGVLIILIIIGALYLAGNLTGPIISGKEFAWEISHGKLDGALDFCGRKDELGELGASLNTMARNLNDLNWLKDGKEGLNDVLRGEWDLKELAGRFIRFYVEHMEAQMGAVYLTSDEEEILELTASYAFTDREGNFNKIRLGEGMIGQAALEQEPIYFSNPVEAPSLNFGAAERIPPHFMIAPLIFEATPLGVFFVASMTPFSDQQRTFSRDNIGDAAIMFNTARSREMINSLLLHAQEQREELRVINEELEEQTRALKESEEELQAQQEELRVTNEELEERTQALEQQTKSVSYKNVELTRAQQEIEKKASDLEVASKYKSEFLANMSHELRTPLNSILILSQLFANNKDGNLSERQIESARAIYSSGSDLLKLINEILDLSKVEAGKIELNLEDMDFSGMIADLQRVFKDLAADKEIRFEVLQSEEIPPSIHTDSHRLQQVLRNLLTNAFKFTRKDGTVKLRIEQPSAEQAAACGLKPEESVAIHVEDNGIGIPREKQAAIFEAFQQADGSTSRKYGGTGLGLSISRELSKLLGGNLQLESEKDRGSTFTIILPRVHIPRDEKAESDSESPAQDRPVASGPVSGEPAAEETEDRASVNPAVEMLEVKDDRHSIKPGDKTLLIIEDDPRFVRILRDLALERGFKCLIAEDGETGLHFADYYSPGAIILDIGLPGIDGWTVMERLKNDPELRHIPVHFISGTDQSMEALKMGAVGYLTKPVSMEKIQDAFGKIEHIISRSVRRLLVVEDDTIQRESIRQLIGEGDVETVAVGTGREAFEELQSRDYDCMILDLGLEDMSGFELLEKIRGDESSSRIPIIIYTGRDLSRDEEDNLKKYSESIIIKGARSPERLLDETALFLHRVEADLPPDKQRMLNLVHDKNSVFKGKKILLVDDDMRNVFALSSVLEEKEMIVEIARNGVESLEKLKDHDDVNLVLMDIMMPEMDGYEAMRRIRKQQKFKKMPIIALTAKAMKGDRNKCIEAGASDYLAKPVNTDKLLSMLRVWLYEA